MDGISIFLASWAGILAILGFGMKHLNFSTPLLKYANEAVLPFYILHQTVLLVVGYVVLRWHIPDLLKWVVIVAVSFSLIMGIYELLVRRLNLLRFLFGMKTIKKEQLQEQPSAVPAQ
jgi:peptidoglycan/LPS O-acetylase OafA/YrhL